MKSTIVILATFIFIFVGCAKEEESNLSSGAGRPVSMSMSSYTTARFNPFDLIINSAHAAVSDLKFCFKRLRFKKLVADPTGDNVDLELGEMSISATGTVLGVINVPEGTYNRVEFDLEPGCDDVAVNSVALTNGNGTFVSGSTIKIKFDGTFIVDGSESLELGIQNILTAANSFDGLGGISLKDALEGVSGNL